MAKVAELNHLKAEFEKVTGAAFVSAAPARSAQPGKKDKAVGGSSGVAAAPSSGPGDVSATAADLSHRVILAYPLRFWLRVPSIQVIAASINKVGDEIRALKSSKADKGTVRACA